MPTFQAAGIPTATCTAPAGTRSSVREAGLPTDRAGGLPGTVTKTRAAVGQPRETSGARPGRPWKVWPGLIAAARESALGVYTSPVITDAQFALAEAASERWPVGTLRVDWTDQDYTGPVSDLSWCLRSMTVERSITGELPDAAGMVDGFASGELTAELGGTRPGSALALAEELSPYRADSPLFGVRRTTPWMRADMGLLTEDGAKVYRQLTGPLRKLRVREADHTVTLTALDPSERIRELVTLPTYGEFLNHAMRRPFALTVNTQWVIDYVLRRNGYFASPPPHPDSVIACTGHGGLVGEVGFNGAPIALETATMPNAGVWTEDGHPFGMLGTPEIADNSTNRPDAYQEFWGSLADRETPPVRFQSGGGFGVSLWVHHGPWATGRDTRLVEVRPTENANPRLYLNWMPGGRFYAGLIDQNGYAIWTPEFASVGPARWRHIGVHWRWTNNSTLEIRVRLDGQTRTYTLGNAAVTVPDTALQQGYRANVQVRVMLFRAWSNLSGWPGYTPPTLAEWEAFESHTPEADIDRGHNELLYLPDIAAEDSWDVLKAVSGAEFGVLGFTEAGRPFFRRRVDSTAVEPEVDLDVAENLSTVDYTVSSDSVRNVIGYQSTARYHDAKFQTVVKAEDILQFVVPGGRAYVYEFDWPYGAAGYQGGVLPYHRNAGQTSGWTEWSNDVQHGWTYSYGSGWTGGGNPQSVVVKYVQVDARRVRVSVDNRNGSQTIRIATPATANTSGEPALRIGGWPILTRPAHVEEFRDEASIARYGSPRALALGNSDWRQTPGVLDPVARQLLSAMAEEVPVLEDLPVRGDPRVQVGMVARARFRGEATQPIIGTIVKTARDLDSGGLHDRISLRPLPFRPGGGGGEDGGGVQTLAPPGWTFFTDTSRYQFDRADPLNLPLLAQLGYAGNIAKIGQGAGRTWEGTQYGQTLDPYWASTRDTCLPLFPDTFAGYWYCGDTESPTSQAQRCRDAIGDTSIPVMLDWEAAGGTWQNLLDVLAAFRTQGLRVTMLYCGSGYANDPRAGPASNIDDTGLHLIRARYANNNRDHPRVLFDEVTDPRGFYLAPFAGGTPDAAQFTQYGEVYPGMAIDVDCFPGTPTELAAMMQGR